MKQNIAKFLKISFPYLSVLLLWRLSANFWNPGGILALIPIFYYSFIKRLPWFTLFAILFCFLIDYNMDSLLFWTFVYCLFYAAVGFQNFIDVQKQEREGLFIFMSYFGISLLIFSLIGFTFNGIIHAIWLLLWGSVLYVPFSAFAKRIDNDR